VKLVRGRRRHGGCRRVEGPCRRRAHFGPRRGHRACLTSLKHAGAWELARPRRSRRCLNGLRDRIVVQTDGQMKTGAMGSPCSAPRSSASPPPRSSCRAA
jgi:hypothetical protein